MTTATSSANEISQLRDQVALLDSQNQQYRVENQLLQEQLSWFKRQLFGSKSERFVETPANQLTLFDLPQQEPPEQRVTAHVRKAIKRHGQDALILPDDLPVETQTLDITPKEGMVKIGEEVTRKLAFKPGSFFIKETIRPKYGNGEEVLTADLPNSIITPCRADESLLAEILVAKFADHLPLYRISEIFARVGIGVSRQLLSKWVVQIGSTLTPLAERLKERILSSSSLFIDESPVPIQSKHKAKKCYLWVICSGPLRHYTFKEGRHHVNAQELLQDYSGYLHSDKYQAYEKLAKQVTWCPCWAHIRRKFFEAGDTPFRTRVLEQIGQLFAFEQEAQKLGVQERLAYRKLHSTPLIDQLTQEIQTEQSKPLPKSKLSQAIGYYLGLIPYLKNYLDEPTARPDNNCAERAIRPLALGRKNWLFFGSDRGAKAGANLLSLIQTCRALEINPRVYLEDVLRRFMGHPYNRLNELLPDEWLKRRKSDRPPD